MRDRFRGAAFGLATLCASSAALAQTAEVDFQPQFSVERLTPAPGPGTFWQVEDGDVATHLAPNFAFVSSLMSRPLVVRHVFDGSELSEPVAVRVGADLLASVGLLDRYQVGLALPLVLFQDGDRLMGLDIPEPGADEPLATAAPGDLRLHAKVRIVEPAYGYGLGTAGAVIITLPTGDDEHFAGEAGVVIEGRVIGSYRHRRFAVAANLGARIRTEEVQFLAPTVRLGNEVTAGVAGSLELPGVRGWTLLGELTGASDLDGGPSPGEARLGVRRRLRGPWSVGGAMGIGIGGDAAIGAPGFRALVEVRFDPSPRVDSDRDGIPDADDLCPLVQEDVDRHQDWDGCIDEDNDGDGIPDDKDECPDDPEDKDRYRDRDGCPELDNDDDGILDKFDACPLDAEDVDGFADDDGCVDGDNDSDGIPDAVDGCRDDAEDMDGHLDDDGCPELDNDGDGILDKFDVCPLEAEDLDGWLDDDGCMDSDDDRDGVPDGVDACLDQPETITSPTDVDADGCPDGTPMAKPAPDGTIWLSPAAKAALVFPKGKATLTPAAAVVLRAIARAAHRAGWNTVPGEALAVTAFGDAPEWNDLAVLRSEAIKAVLEAEGVRTKIVAELEGKGIRIVGTPEGVAAGPSVPVRVPKANP